MQCLSYFNTKSLSSTYKATDGIRYLVLWEPERLQLLALGDGEGKDRELIGRQVEHPETRDAPDLVGDVRQLVTPHRQHCDATTAAQLGRCMSFVMQEYKTAGSMELLVRQ